MATESRTKLELSGLQTPRQGGLGYLAFSVKAPWMKGHLVLRAPETVNSSQGLHFIDHRIETMPPLAMPEAGIEWKKNESTGAVEYQTRTKEGVVFGTKAWPEGETVHCEFRVRNETGAAMNGVGNQQCLVLTGAEGFGRKMTLDTTYTWIDGKFTCLNTTTPTAEEKGTYPWIMVCTKQCAKDYHGPREVKTAWWVVDQVADEYIIVRVSEDGKHLVAITWDESPTQMLMTNTWIPCLHAGPLVPVDLEPGREHLWRGRIYLMENDPQKLLDLYLRDKATAGA